MPELSIPYEDLSEPMRLLIDAAIQHNEPLPILSAQQRPLAILLSPETYAQLLQASASPAEETQEEQPRLSRSGRPLLEPQEASRVIENFKNAYLELLLDLASAMDSHESYVAGHSDRLAILASDTARVLNCTAGEIEHIRWAALLHDIGEIFIPEGIFSKYEKLSEEELNLIRQHPQTGADFVSRVQALSPIAAMIHAHHEWYNGQGYPDGLKADEIPLGARIIAVVDTYDAITNLRLHRKSGNHEIAVSELQKGAGTRYDPQVVDAFLTLF